MKEINNIFKKNNKIIKISVVGGSFCDHYSYDISYNVGKEIAKKNAILICGGLGGVMEACCRGAKEEGGITIGILPTEDENTANKYIDIKIPTGIGYARNILVVLSAHAVIAINGGFGTLSEIAFAHTYKKPVIGLSTWKLSPCSEEYTPGIIAANTPDEAVKIAIKEAKQII